MVFFWLLVIAACVPALLTLPAVVRHDGLGHRPPPPSERPWAENTRLRSFG